MIFKVIIPARANSKRLPGKNMKVLGGKPLIQHSIDFAKKSFLNKDIWVNSDDPEVLQLAKTNGIMSLHRPEEFGGDFSSTADVLKHHAIYVKRNKIACDAMILLQPTNPFRDDDLFADALRYFKELNRNSLAIFSISEKKLGKIENVF